MSKKLFNDKDIEPNCGYCQHSKPSITPENILCQLKGVMPVYSKCRRFKYDALKRKPHRNPALPEFDPDDFKM